MTNQVSINVVSHQRHSRRLVPPFGDGSNPSGLSNLLARVLESCKFAPYRDVRISDEDSYTLLPEDADRPVEPRFELTVSDDVAQRLLQALNCAIDDLAMGLTLRNRHLRQYETLETWKLSELPDGVWELPTTKLGVNGLHTGRDIDFVLSLRVISKRRELEEQGLGLGKTLVRKEFSVRESVDTSTFPFRWSEFGGASGYHEKLLWAVEWKQTEDERRFDLPVHEVLTVIGNAKADEKLSAMSRASNGLAWRMLAAEIITQIWSEVLSKTIDAPDEDDTYTLAGQVFSHLAYASGMTYKELPELGSEDGLTKLRGLVSASLEVVE